jgi:hypothetical protein
LNFSLFNGLGQFNLAFAADGRPRAGRAWDGTAKSRRHQPFIARFLIFVKQMLRNFSRRHASLTC